MQGCQCELDYEIGVISFLVDVIVWENGHSLGHIEGPVVQFRNLTRKLLWSIGSRWDTSESGNKF